jgi:hypothetical protein
MADSKRTARLLYRLAGVVVAAGVVGFFVAPFGKTPTCVEFSGCRMENGAVRIGIAIAAFILSAVLLAGASAAKNRWRRDTRYWKPSDSH